MSDPAQPASAASLPGFAIDVRAHGAVGDGLTDDTAAIQRAIDAAGIVRGAVHFPPGVYLSGRLQMRSNMALVGTPTWGYCDNGGTIIKLNDPQAHCLIDLCGTRFTRIIGMSLVGDCTGKPVYPADGRGVVGIHLDGTGHQSEETLVIDNTRVAHFSGHAVELLNVWGFTLRHSMCIFNGGDGLRFTRWDGWVNDCVFNNCAGYAIHAMQPNASVTFVANRIEWCYKGGIRIVNGGHHQINANYFDRCGGPAIHISGRPEQPVDTFSITGNLLHRNGALSAPDDSQCSHVVLEQVAGCVLSGNTMSTGVNDSGQGQLSPSFGLVLRGLTNSLIKDNVIHQGAIRQLVLDLGEHDAATQIRDNIGSLKIPPAPPAQQQQQQQQ